MHGRIAGDVLALFQINLEGIREDLEMTVRLLQESYETAVATVQDFLRVGSSRGPLRVSPGADRFVEVRWVRNLDQGPMTIRPGPEMVMGPLFRLAASLPQKAKVCFAVGRGCREATF